MYFLFQVLNSSALTGSSFIFSSSLLKFSLCSPILLPSSVSILFTIALNCLSGKLFICFIRFFSGVFSCSFETYSSFFSFCLTFSVSLKLGETVAYPGLEGVSLC